MKIVFPTKENMSYISHSASSIEEANYLTVLDIQNQSIVGVHTVQKRDFSGSDGFLKECLENKYEAIVVPQSCELPLAQLKEAGICVYTDNSPHMVLDSFHDYVHNKLAQA
ncbi:MAG: hypothetical protein ACNI3C_08055 [Candidatus Marinarcus sp.]|uniref:hypothetical protein n=1 Tax=Candidatus Marinarcus sp. TaxID=3100987 RepID=UPI003AFFB0D7